MGSRVRGADQPELELFPKARLPRYADPKTDNERLLTYQARWLEDGDEQARGALWELALEVAARCVKGVFWRRKVRASREVREDCAMEAVLYLMGRYASPATYTRTGEGRQARYRDVYGWNYCVLHDYVSAIAQAVRHAVNYRTKADRIVDYITSADIELIAGGHHEDYGLP